MRMTKIPVAAAVAVASLAFTTAVAPAQAEQTASARVAFGTFDAFAKDNNTLVAKGRANDFRRRIVLIQRAPKASHRWKTIDRVRTDSNGRFRTTIQAGSEIPCTGKKFKIRAKKKGVASWKVDDQVWSC